MRYYLEMFFGTGSGIVERSTTIKDYEIDTIGSTSMVKIKYTTVNDKKGIAYCQALRVCEENEN